MPPSKDSLSVAFGALIFLVATAQADLLDDLNRALYFSNSDASVRLRLSGLVDLEGYYFTQPAPALIESNDNWLLNPRLTVFIDAQLGQHLYGFAQLRFDRGFDPSDEGANFRADEYFLRLKPFDEVNATLQAGKFATVVGNWVQRHYSWDNPFINAPLPYENLTGIWDSQAPFSADELLFWGHVGKYDSHNYSDKYLRLPIIWGPSYASGIQFAGSVNKFDFAVELKNTALASRPESWDLSRVDFDHPTLSSRIGYRPNEMWTLGFSVSSGAYLLETAEPTLPAGHTIGDYHEKIIAQDISFAWHYLQIWAECFETRFEIPRIGNADSLAYYLEAKYKLSSQLYAALRWNQQLFGSIPYDETTRTWDNDAWRIDAAVGYRFTSYLQMKLQYSFTDDQNANQLVATQLTFKF